MLAALIIVFREVLEAGLIIGVVLAASRGVPGRGRAVAIGVLCGIAGSIVVAGFAAQISAAFDGRGQELFTAAVLALAVLMLAWHVIWMSEHARELTARLRHLGDEVSHGAQSVAALGIAAGAAVMREGSEVVLFLTGIGLQSGADASALVLGSLGGLTLGAAVAGAIYLGLSAIPLRRIFSVTGVLVTLLAAGLAAEAVRQLANAGLIDGLSGALWDTSWLLPEESWFGRVVHVLVGYTDRPTELQASVYAACLVAIFIAANRKQVWRALAGNVSLPLSEGQGK